MPGGNKWAVMGGIALNAEYTRKYGFDATAAAKVTAKLVAVPPPSAFLEAVQASAMGRSQALPNKTKRALPHEPRPRPPWLLPEDLEDNGESQAAEDDFPPLGPDEDEEPTIVIQFEGKANKKYTLDDELSPPSEGTTDEDGWLAHPITPGATRGSLHFEGDPEPIPIEFENAGEA